VIPRLHATSNNPSTNRLGAGISENDVSEAVSRSGYPLQTVIADVLRELVSVSEGQPFVQEEWGYIDTDSKELRTIDILAERLLFDLGWLLSSRKQPRIRPMLNLMIECKQSTLPYIFFLSRGRPLIRHFPLLAGLRHQTLETQSDDDPSTWNFDIMDALGLRLHPFLSTEPEYCATFSKCVRGGSTVELSGSEPFHALVLPILKSMQHFQVIEAPPKTAQYFDCHIAIGIGVLDAPMVGIHVSGQHHELNLLPWVRVIRYETDEVPDWHETRRGLYAIDIVHKDFFKEYLLKHVLPFAETVSGLALKHEEELVSGKAFATDLGKNSRTEIEERLRPRRPGERSKAIGKLLLSLPFRKKPLED